MNADLDFTRLTAIFLTHLHADHCGDLPGMILYPWGVRGGPNGPLDPVQVFGPSRPVALPAGDPQFGRVTIIHPDRPAPGTADLIDCILAGYAYHLNVMPLDARGCPTRSRIGARDRRLGGLLWGGVAERAGVGELILTHYLPADPAAISAADGSRRAGQGFSGRTTAGFDGLRAALPRSPAARTG